MPDITSPQLTRFANEKGRVFADALGTTYQTAKRFQQEWAALEALPPDTADLFADGSDVDGRKRVTGAQMTALKTIADTMVTWFETGTPMRITQIQRLTVNDGPRF